MSGRVGVGAIFPASLVGSDWLLRTHAGCITGILLRGQILCRRAHRAVCLGNSCQTVSGTILLIPSDLVLVRRRRRSDRFLFEVQIAVDFSADGLIAVDRYLATSSTFVA